MSVARPLTPPEVRYTTPVVLVLLGAAILIGVLVTLLPLFGRSVPSYAATEFVAHVALVDAALDTWRTTGALPLSSGAIHPGIEYPYFVFGNQAFYWLASLISLLLGLPAYLGAGLALVGFFALGTCGMFALAVRAGLHPYLAVGLGFLYATGPYPSVNLFVRNAFPEYTMWEVLPALVLACQQAMRPGAGRWSLLGGAVALAAPFYLHKLVAPHVALMLGVLATNATAHPFRPGTIARLGVLAALGLLFSAPSWLAAARGLDQTTVGMLGGAQKPSVLHPSLVNLFWPWATNSLPLEGGNVSYQGRFALQVGFIPLVGMLAAVGALLIGPRRFWNRRLALPLLLLAANAILILGLFGAWEIAPSPLRYLQFTYRLVGLAHLLGFVLFIQAVPILAETLGRGRSPRVGRWAVLVCLGLATLSGMTYWHRPGRAPLASADIQAGDMAGLDSSAFWPKTIRGNLVTARSIEPQGWLATPPYPVTVPADVDRIFLAATAPPELFDQAAEPLTVRVYGFTRQNPEANVEHIHAILSRIADAEKTPAPTGVLFGKARADPAVPRAADGAPLLAQVTDVPWAATLLAETSIAGPGSFRLRAPLRDGVAAVAVECSRGVGRERFSRAPESRQVCINVDYLAIPNEGTRFVVPRELPTERLARSAFGTVDVDARDLPAGHYLLPTFDYTFVRAADANGSPLNTYQFDRRPAFRHTDATAYRVSFDFRPELLAVLAGLALFAAHTAATRPWRRVRTPDR